MHICTNNWFYLNLLFVDARSIQAVILLYHLMPDTKTTVNRHRIFCLVPVSFCVCVVHLHVCVCAQTGVYMCVLVLVFGLYVSMCTCVCERCACMCFVCKRVNYDCFKTVSCVIWVIKHVYKLSIDSFLQDATTPRDAGGEICTAGSPVLWCEVRWMTWKDAFLVLCSHFFCLCSCLPHRLI